MVNAGGSYLGVLGSDFAFSGFGSDLDLGDV